ncbi:MAG TPA: YciI family protein [Polyangia bacterium]
MMILVAEPRQTPAIDTEIDSISAYLAQQQVNVLGSERLADEGATIAEYEGSAAVVTGEVSVLRAIWILDLPSRAEAVELARKAPGGEGTLEIRESFTPQDFGAPPDPSPPVAPPPPRRKPGTHRYIAILRAHHESAGPPTLESVAPMDAYCAPLVEANTMIGGEGLKPSAKGTRVRRSAAQRFVLDGPFAESKELVGGYMIVQVPSLDEAIDTIRPWLRIHREALRVGQTTIEVRRLV